MGIFISNTAEMAEFTDSYFHSAATGTYTLTLRINQTSFSRENNTSEIEYALILTVTGSGFGNFDTGASLSIHSEATGGFILQRTFDGRASCSIQSPLTLLSGSLSAVSHNPDGSLALSAQASAQRTGSNSYFNRTLNISDALMELPVIPRVSSIDSFPSFTAEESFTLGITKYDLNYRDDITFYLGDQAIKTIDDYHSGDEVYFDDLQLLAIYEALGSEGSGVMRVELSTEGGLGGQSELMGEAEATAEFTLGGTMQIKAAGAWRGAIPWIKMEGVWKRAIASGNCQGSWKRGK